MLLKQIKLKLSDNAWFVPFLYGCAGILLTAVTPYLGLFLRDLLPEILYLEKDSAANVLIASFTSLMTMMTFSFSTILVVLTTYTSQFSPRTVNNFLTNSTAKHTLGIFILTTVYSVSNLFLIRTEKEDVVLASGVSALLVIYSIWSFVRFIQTISLSVQVERLMSSLHKEALSVIEKQQQIVREGNMSIVPVRSIHAFEGHAIYAQETGYIQLFLFEEQKNCSVDFESVVAVGDFVAKGDLLGYWVGKEAADKELYQLGKTRSPMQDPVFSIEKLSEIAVKAISPGINDPNTAIHAIQYLGDVLRELCQLPEGDLLYSSDQCDWHVKRKDMENILFEALAPIKNYAQGDIFVLSSVFEAIRIARLHAHPSTYDAFENIVNYFEEVIDWESFHDREKSYLFNRMMKAKKVK